MSLPNDGEWLATLKRESDPNERKWTTAFCLSLFFGVLGFDRFYLGFTGLGLLKFCTLGGFGYWWVADCVLLLLGRMKDGEGRLVQRRRK